MLSKSIILLAFMSAVYASTFRSWQKTLTWGPCQGDMNFTSDYPYQCATLNVPLDYTNPHGPARLNLALLKVNATKQPAMGSILFNPGGPGSPGTATVAEGAEQFQQ